MTVVHKKHEAKEEEAKITASAIKLKKPVVVSDVITETTERIEVIEEVTPKTKSDSGPLHPTSDVPQKKNFMWQILFIVFLALASMVGIFIYKQGMNKGMQVKVVTLSPTPTRAPIPTAAEIDLSKYEIKILNGSKVDGEARRQKANLEAEGFTVVLVGNAAKSDYTKTIIQAKEDVDKDSLGKLKSVLEQSFVVGEIEELPEDADSDVIVIIGSLTN